MPEDNVITAFFVQNLALAGAGSPAQLVVEQTVALLARSARAPVRSVRTCTSRVSGW